ncbi:hypothetical protein HPB51_010319 [Rhipicephalus microplus]|uniref:Cuticle protein n=1 Tax=Rhipicephalus microplus TaxID=6941 RepID=A0A9J6DG35_RHIMP|nr:hypothetical protein HPB51_010319 [Rhipicephalus microplus]
MLSLKTQGLGAYQYGYDWTFPEGHGAFQRESGNAAGHKQGSYGLKYADGTVRIVSYIADEAGFRVSISTNEPGTLSSSPADALFQVPQEPYQASALEPPKTSQPVQFQVPTKTSQIVAAVPVAVTATNVVPDAVAGDPTTHEIPVSYHNRPRPRGSVVHS